eukprot:Sdes_comp16691_c0_seq1m5977
MVVLRSRNDNTNEKELISSKAVESEDISPMDMEEESSALSQENQPPSEKSGPTRRLPQRKAKIQAQTKLADTESSQEDEDSEGEDTSQDSGSEIHAGIKRGRALMKQ